MRTLEELKDHVASIVRDEVYFSKHPNQIGAHFKFNSRALVGADGIEYVPQKSIDELCVAVVELVMYIFKYVVDNHNSYDFENLGVSIAKEIKPHIVHKRVVVQQNDRLLSIYVALIEVEDAYNAIYKYTREGVINEILKDLSL